jgi:trimethylamine--corrinoid protein Co-methyltransferase
MLDLGMTFSHEQLLIDNEIVRMVNRVLRGIPVNDATLGVDTIAEVGPGGTFLGEDHTLEFMKSESSLANLFDRLNRPNWEDEGSTNVKDRANKAVQQILQEHKPVPLEKDAADEIRSIIGAAEKELL